MKKVTGIPYGKIVLVIFPLLTLSLSGVVAADEDDPFERHMKFIGKRFKFIKTALAKDQVEGIKDAANAIAAEVVKVKGLTPPINKARIKELPPLADKAAEAARALAGAEGMGKISLKFIALGNRCKTCHDIFQPEE